jgi:hypothetical protein
MSEVNRAQPNFPHEDISEVNAEYFKGICSDEARFNHYCASADANRPYGPSLLSLHSMAARNPLLSDPVAKANVRNGMTLYDAMGYLATPQQYHAGVAHGALGTFAAILPRFEDDLKERFDPTYIEETFTEEMRRTADTIGECAVRLFGKRLDYVIVGAALARQLEIDARKSAPPRQ